MAESLYIEPVSGQTYPLSLPRWCSSDRKPLMITPQPGMTRDDIDRTERSQWRYRASLPLDITHPISMGEGCTPLIQKAWGDHRPYFKLEWFNPTSSFKDRGTTVMLSVLRQQGIESVLEDSSGNGGASVSAYGAAGNMRVKILAPSFASPAKIAQMRAYGAEVQLVDGPRQECENEAVRQSSKIFYTSHNWQPFFLEGTKSIGYEIWEDLNFRVPDNIVMPVGAGSNVLGCFLAFSELLRAGQIKKLPKLFVCQPLNCSPIDAHFHAGYTALVQREVRPTISEGTAISSPLRLREVINAVRSSGGCTVALEEQAIIDALKRSARQGLLPEFTSATAVAGFERLIATGAIRASEETVVLLTGTGIKNAGAIAELFS
ncbi:threonine synthase [Klebsiella quasipneumoniae]|uniref:threonine synthase n=1 Tax=Klebsiella quasipneumoniae TaxID=1463165 RepID=UPI002447F671|nr:threonine synthase [Klebsiella quasipneumoniae]MDH2712396.1 threonine synthase [Klebsiella quasipneumoniae]